MNRYMIQFENKFFENHSPVKSIDDVLNMINYKDVEISNDIMGSDVMPVYISYSWENSSDAIVNHFCLVLEQNGIAYKRDKKDCNYMDNIKDFMDSIRNGDLIVVVFSRKYMLSKNCIYELSGIMQHEDWTNKILHVVVDDSIWERSFTKNSSSTGRKSRMI